jgi:ABC-type sugar transport system substrate-binding protein
MNRQLSAFLVAATMIGGSATAAPAETSYTIGITGFVPTICHAQLDTTVIPAQSGETSLGKLNEFCNSPNGYQVFVEGSPELANATLVVDGQPITLAANGPTLVASSDRPNIAARDVSLASNGAAGSLSFRIVSL